MRKSIVSGLIGLLPLTAFAQQMDMAAAAKWSAADVVKYHIVGEFKGTYHVASDASGKADFTDRVIIDLTWKHSDETLVGAPAIQNSKSAVSNLRDREAACFAPVLKGNLEFFDLKEVVPSFNGGLYLKSQTIYPVVEIAQFCTASRRSVPAKIEDNTEDFGIPSPMVFAMPPPKSGEYALSADKKSLIVKKGDWTWTLTPTIVR